MEDEGVVLNELGRSQGILPNDSADSRRCASTNQPSTAVASLPIIMTSDYESTSSLLDTLVRNKDFVQFIKICASYWPKGETSTDKLHQGVYIAVRTMLWICAAYSFALMVDAIHYQRLVGIFLWSTTCLDFLSVIPGQYLNQQRLLQPARTLDASVVDESLHIARVFAILSGIAVLIAVIVIAGHPEVLDLLLKTSTNAKTWLFLFLLSQVFIVMYLAFNLFFLLLDVKVSLLLIDQLILLAEDKSLTMERFNLVRDDIHRRVHSSKVTSDFIVAPCTASVVAIVVIVFFVDLREGGNGVLIGAALILLLLKELFFVAIAFWYVAKVNERADRLTTLLSRCIWRRDTEYASMADLERVSMHASSLSEPISFTLLFKRVSYENVAIGTASLVVTILFGVLEEVSGVQ